MTPGQRSPIDLELVRQLQAQGVPLQQESAKTWGELRHHRAIQTTR
jgi:hypothetical protein